MQAPVLERAAVCDESPYVIDVLQGKQQRNLLPQQELKIPSSNTGEVIVCHKYLRAVPTGDAPFENKDRLKAEFKLD